jgi:hypothetical protein
MPYKMMPGSLLFAVALDIHSMQSGSKARYRASSLQISKLQSISTNDSWPWSFVHVRLDGIDGKRDVPALRQDLCTQYTACTYIHTYLWRYLLHQTLDFTTPPNEWWKIIDRFFLTMMAGIGTGRTYTQPDFSLSRYISGKIITSLGNR